MRLKEVSFSTCRRFPLIKNLSLRSNAERGGGHRGTHRGRGKTTIINLLMRFYDIDKGLITVDGEDIGHLTRDSLREGRFHHGAAGQLDFLWHGA